MGAQVWIQPRLVMELQALGRGASSVGVEAAPSPPCSTHPCVSHGSDTLQLPEWRGGGQAAGAAAC